MLNVFSAVLLILILPFAISSVNCSPCSPELLHATSYYQEGDLIIGGILSVRTITLEILEKDFTQRPYIYQTSCFIINYINYQHVLSFLYAIDEINRNPNLLPNLTLGFHIVDSCLDERTSLFGLFSTMSGRADLVPNFNCKLLHKLVAIVEGISSKVSLLLARMCGSFKIPQISYATLDPVLSDKIEFPYFYRTVPNDVPQYKAMAQLIKYFGWSWVGVLVSDNESGIKMSQFLQKELMTFGYCIAFLEFIPTHKVLTEAITNKIVQSLSIPSVNVVIFYGDREYMSALHIILYRFPIKEKVWVISSQWDITAGLDYTFLSLQPFNGCLAFTIKSNKISGFKEFILNLNPRMHPNDVFFKDVWMELFICDLSDRNCSENHIKDSTFLDTFTEFSFHHYSIYNAVYALAHAIHSIYSNRNEARGGMKDITSWNIHKLLKRVHFLNSAGAELHFDDKGDMYGVFDVINWIQYPNQTLHGVRVGRYDEKDSINTMFIDETLIRWNPAFNQTPSSVCNKACLPGFRKSAGEGKVECCYNCIPCPEGEISNETDSEVCQKCPSDQWPNFQKDACLFKEISYLAFNEPLGIILTASSILIFIINCMFTAIFTKYKNTPIMKANNQTLSYILLFSLKMSFLSVLLFIGPPMHLTCLLRQVIFGISFSISVSSILAKTVVVVVAFHATRPGSKLRKFLGPKIFYVILFVCSSCQVLICALWLGISPPFPYYNTEDDVGKIIAVCHEGSLVGFYFVLGYMGLLSCVSFIVAFLSRNFPDIFNEAKYITFSMLASCSVWISFVPAYLSTKGKYVVAVEIFAILTSTSGLLGCIFIPKCYFALRRTELGCKVLIKHKYST